MELNKLNDALGEAQLGLQEVEVDYELLRARKEKLEKLISLLREVLEPSVPAGSGALALVRPSDNTTATPPRGNQAIWFYVREVLLEKLAPMTVPDLVSELECREIRTSPEAVRVAISRRSEVFRRFGHGQYGLIEWTDTTPDIPTLGIQETSQKPAEAGL